MKFNNEKLKEIDILIKKLEYKEALRKVNKYLCNYPEDKKIFLVIAELMYRLEDYDQALSYIELFNNESDYNDFDILKRDCLIIKIYIAKKMYNKAYELLINRKNILLDRKNEKGYVEFFMSDILLYFLQSRLNFENIKSPSTYTEKQIINYDEKDALRQIKGLYLEDNFNLFNMQKNKFNKKIDVEKVFYQIKDNIKDMKPNYYSPIINMYMFKYENIGKNINGEELSYLEVFVLEDTKEILTMVPCEKIDKYIAVDITPKEDICDKNSISRIEKFYKKYKK